MKSVILTYRPGRVTDLEIQKSWSFSLSLYPSIHQPIQASILLSVCLIFPSICLCTLWFSLLVELSIRGFLILLLNNSEPLNDFHLDSFPLSVCLGILTFVRLSEVKWSEMKSLSPVRLFVSPWTVAHQAPLSMGFSRQEYWSGLPFPSAGYLPDPGIEPRSSALQADTLPSEPPGKSGTL